ncbi:MAG TPA: tetratricopeptide repeat protein, partial [Caldimonas sp.]|nr:tetratricopeptide repeat protein [Caldimonas sp.]
VANAAPTTAHRAAPAGDHGRRHVLAGALGAALVAVTVVAAAVLVWRQVDARPVPTAPTGVPLAAANATPIARAPLDAIGFGAGASAETSTFTSAAVVDFAAAASSLATPPSTAPTEAERSEPDRSDIARSGASLPTATTAAAIPNRAADAGPTLASTALVAPARVEKITPAPSPAERAESEYRRGIDLHEHANGSDAETAFAAALQLDGRHAAARQALAIAWIGHGRGADAERLLGEGLAQNAQQPQLAVVLARLQAERHDLRAGIDTLRASLGGNAAAPAEQAEARALMATLQQSAGQHREAIDSYAAALRQAPQNGTWWIALGLSLAAEGRSESAREAFERARSTGTLAPELLLYVEQRLRPPTP